VGLQPNGHRGGPPSSISHTDGDATAARPKTDPAANTETDTAANTATNASSYSHANPESSTAADGRGRHWHAALRR